MKILYLDPFSGIAGDMLCAALIDLGADIDAMREVVGKLPLSNFKISAQRTRRGPLSAVKFSVSPANEVGDDLHHDLPSQGLQPIDWPGEAHHRTWKEIRSILEESNLPAEVSRRALLVFAKLAEAEGAVHGQAPDSVHFHEVGAIDSIVDIVCACQGLVDLGIDEIICGPLPLGTGSTTTEHGLIPLPAPATVALLSGWPIIAGTVNREEITPTGAALVAALAKPGSLPNMTLVGTGYGAGSANPSDKPNVVRAILGQAPHTTQDDIHVIESHMDDLTGEHLPPLITALLNAGAVDAFASTVLMKKGRSGLAVTAICKTEAITSVTRALLLHGSTFGVRRYPVVREILDRRFIEVETPYGMVSMKQGLLEGAIVHCTPEFEDVRRLAEETDTPVPVVHTAAISAWHQTKQP